MRKLTPQRRLAAIAGGLTAAFAGLPALLHTGAHTTGTDGARAFGAGMCVGIPIAFVVFLLVRRRRTSAIPISNRGV
jgi:hypothetical protein